MPLIALAYSEGLVRYHGDGVVASYPMDEQGLRGVYPGTAGADRPVDVPAPVRQLREDIRTRLLSGTEGQYTDAVRGGDAIAYSPLFLLNGSVATAAGREVLGIQKVNCDISFTEYDKKLQ